MVFSYGFRARLRTVRVGKTAIQIIRASWCLLGGPTGRLGAAPVVGAVELRCASDMTMLLVG
jgi:hypothetical protein